MMRKNIYTRLWGQRNLWRTQSFSLSTCTIEFSHLFNAKKQLEWKCYVISTPSFCTSVSVIRILTSSYAYVFLWIPFFSCKKIFHHCVREKNQQERKITWHVKKSSVTIFFSCRNWNCERKNIYFSFYTLIVAIMNKS